jgi:hypothetical protein
MRILVCGCRDWTNIDVINLILKAQGPGHILIEGGAKGADTLAKYVALSLGWEVESYPADWKTYGRAAGPIRNAQMLSQGRPNVVVAFWDGESRGTLDMIRKTIKSGKPVNIIPPTYNYLPEESSG